MSATRESAADHVYFQAIEEAFIRLRGAPLLLSPDDWQLARKWRHAGIPLDLVLTTLEEVFEVRRARGTQRPIRGLRYCDPAVEEAWTRHQELTATGRQQPTSGVDVAARLAALAAAVADHPGVESGLEQRILALRGSPEAVERALIELDREMMAGAEHRVEPELHEQLEASSAATAESLAQRLTADEIGRLRARLHREGVRRHLGLPVLSLFSAASPSG